MSDNNWIYSPLNFLDRLSQEDRAVLYAAGEQRLYKKGEHVFRAGSPALYVYFVEKGQIKIYESSSLGKDVILWFCFAGEMFGMAESPRGSSRVVFAQACSDASVLVVPRDDFSAVLRSCPNAALLVIDLLSGRLRGLGDMLLNLTSEDVSSRLLKLLIRLGQAYGHSSADRVVLDIALTHQELADMIGTSRQTVTSILGDLRRQGLVQMERQRISIMRPAVETALQESGHL